MMKRGRRGLSEVIAAMVILLISVLLGTLFFAFGSAALDLTQSGFIQQTALSRDRLEERITVTSIFNVTEGANNTLYIAVFNYGKRGAELETVFVGSDSLTAYEFGASVNNFTVCEPDNRSICNLSNLVNVRELVWIFIEDPLGGLTSGTTYRVVVATARGNSFELLFKA